ncbi:MAG: carboxypeptidase-like regulatory domain-containing protein, partial [Bacteroidota bacterium]
MKKLFPLMFVVLFLGTTSLFAQTIEGIVQDETGPLPGVNIIEKGTNNGTSTDFEGRFSLNVKSTKGTIEVSFVGMSVR